MLSVKVSRGGTVIVGLAHVGRRLGAHSLLGAGASLLVAGLVGLRLIPSEMARVLAGWALPLAGGWSAVLIVVSARALGGRERVAWTLAGGAVGAFAAGQGTWTWHVLVVGESMPAWGLQDVFFVGAFGAVLGSLLLMPQAAQQPYERLRLIFDMSAGVVALLVLVWVTRLGDLAEAVSRGADARTVSDLVYAVVDGLVLAGVMVVLVRPARYRFDPRVLLGALALVASAVVDFANVDADRGVVEPGDPVSALWLVAFGLTFLLGGVVGSAPDRLPDPEQAGRRRSGMVAAYGAVLGVVGVLVYDLTVGLPSSDRAVVGVGVVVLGALAVARQSAAIRENRLLVETARDRLVASVSHELRTPLTAAVGFTELLRTRWDSLPEAERIEIMTLTGRSLEQLSRLVSDLLMVQRGYLDSRTLRLGPVRADELAVRSVAALPELAVHDVEVDVPSDLKAETDPDRAVQILTGLLDNAFKYGRPPVTLRARPRGEMVVFEVHDAGPGIAARHQVDIWEAFERGAHRLDAQRPGSGLGLTTARALARALGGSIGYRRSRELGGACFEVSLPQA
ncbi:MAG: HAMP domain-containing sensor histidine kinase [Acidimicrobiia bacterium]|nr:HAMP domain-containing sensor histidine kinase [Acidimicrobiia bacterium]